MTLFHVIGLVVSTFLVVVVVALILIWTFYRFLDGRFGAMFFRKTARKLSIVSWHQTRTMQMGNKDCDPNVYTFDDFPICSRPGMIHYRIGQRRYFIMVGFYKPMRFNVGKGKRPE
jgi:hypothetical protein